MPDERDNADAQCYDGTKGNSEKPCANSADLQVNDVRIADTNKVYEPDRVEADSDKKKPNCCYRDGTQGQEG